MTNNQIIFETVQATFSPDQLTQLVNAVYTPEQIAACRQETRIESESAEDAENIFNALLVAENVHTFQQWKRLGYSVKKGQHAALVCNLWKYTDKPGRAARDAAAAAGEDTPETDPHYYRTRAHLFHRLQVERSR